MKDAVDWNFLHWKIFEKRKLNWKIFAIEIFLQGFVFYIHQVAVTNFYCHFSAVEHSKEHLSPKIPVCRSLVYVSLRLT